ncbi:hypothetical protein ACVWXN_000475 [Bradyrhizobium sp. i1.4.4]
MFVFVPPALAGCLPMLSPASFFMLEAPVVVPFFIVPAEEGPTSPCPEAPAAGWFVCANAPAVDNAKIQAEAKTIFFIFGSPWVSSLRITDVINRRSKEDAVPAHLQAGTSGGGHC